MRYEYYWAWYNGTVLEEELGKTKDGKTVYRYPLRINPVRNFARKHAALLFGEVPDTPSSLVKCVATPKKILYPEEPPKREKELADFSADVVNEVWAQSKGRSIQMENGYISQFLGGSVFQVRWSPERKDLLIPITIRNIYPDYFLPIWSPDDPWDLLEAYVAYRVNPATAERYWGIKADGSYLSALYVEHWTKDHYSIYLDGKPLVRRMGDRSIQSYANAPNPFGFVPYVYIPRIREGSFYGSSLVPDIAGVAVEFNSRVADEGDAIRKTAHPRNVGSNITGQVVERDLDKRGNTYLDIGNTNPAIGKEPSLKPLEPPKWSDSYSSYKDFLWSQLMREGGMGPIAFGEDEGSQRSALTLAFRMWPSTIVGKSQRTFWTDGLNQISRYILQMASIKGVQVGGRSIPSDILKMIDVAPDWLPMIPRDREQQVNEIILRLQSGAISIEKALQDFGDVDDVKQEVERIKDWLEFNAQAKGPSGQGAKTDISSPKASSGLKEEQAQ